MGGCSLRPGLKLGDHLRRCHHYPQACGLAHSPTASLGIRLCQQHDTSPNRRPDNGPTGNKFSEIDWVQIDLGDDSHDLSIKTEDRLTIAMARQ